MRKKSFNQKLKDYNTIIEKETKITQFIVAHL